MTSSISILDAELSTELPCALLRLRLFADDPKVRRDIESKMAEIIGPLPGVHAFSEQLIAVLPVAGDAAVFDTAVRLGERLIELGRGHEAGSATAQVLILPGEVVVQSGRIQLITDPLLDDLDIAPPKLESELVHLTSRATKALEGDPVLGKKITHSLPSGRQLPISQVITINYQVAPWRNSELLGRTLPAVPRPRQIARLTAQLDAPIIRVSGPLGSGKSRLVWETLRQQGVQSLWVSSRPVRAGGPSIVEQIVGQLIDPGVSTPESHETTLRIPEQLQRDLAAWIELHSEPADPTGRQDETLIVSFFESTVQQEDGTLHLVCDDFENIAEPDMSVLSSLIESPSFGTSLRLICVGRAGMPWPQITDGAPTVEIPPLSESELDEVAEQILSGLSMPLPVGQRLREASAGYPFALEEGLIALIHLKSFRQVYGSFFYSGDENADYRPSVRLVRHVFAEVERLGATLPTLLLASVNTPIPPDDLRVVAAEMGHEPERNWVTRFLESRFLRAVESPWGDGLEIQSPAYTKALSHVLPNEVLATISSRIGARLAGRSRNGEAYWETYRLMHGTEEAIEPLIATINSPFVTQVPREELLTALSRELEAARERGVPPGIELEILWRLLPLARRQGLLQDRITDLERAVVLAAEDPRRLLALASLKAETDRQAGRLREAEATIQEALKRARGVDERRQALLLIELGRILLQQERYEEAREIFTQLKDTVARKEMSALSATCDFFLGNIAFHKHQFVEARAHHEAAMKERRRQDLLRPLGKSLSALGTLAVREGNYPKALESYREAQDLLSEHGKPADVSFVLLGIGRALRRLGDYTGASQPLRRALGLREGKDDHAGEAIARLAVAENNLDLGQIDAALPEARQAHFNLSLLSHRSALADAERLLGKIRFQQRNYEDAARHFTAAFQKHSEQNNSLASGLDQAWLVEAALALEDEATVRDAATKLKAILRSAEDSGLSELLDFRMFRCLEWMTARGYKVGNPIHYLERSYQKLLAKASHLNPELRHRFLFQIEENQAIVTAATERSITASNPQPDD